LLYHAARYALSPPCPTRRSSDLAQRLDHPGAGARRNAHLQAGEVLGLAHRLVHHVDRLAGMHMQEQHMDAAVLLLQVGFEEIAQDRKSTRLNSSHVKISYAVVCL